MKKEYRTKYKEDIMEYLRLNRETRFCASDVFDYMIGKGMSINLTTVYRNLDNPKILLMTVAFISILSRTVTAGSTCMFNVKNVEGLYTLRESL